MSGIGTTLKRKTIITKPMIIVYGDASRLNIFTKEVIKTGPVPKAIVPPKMKTDIEKPK